MLRFGAFEVVPPKRLLLRDGVPLPLTPKAFDTLLLLLERRDRVVSKEELLSALWPDTAVEEATLSQHIYKIRKALNDEDGVRYIATIPRRGYRFVAEVVEADAGRRAAQDSSQPPSGAVPARRRHAIAIGVLAAAASVSAWLLVAGRSRSEALPIRFTIPAPAGTRLAQLAISPDGQTVVFQAVDAGGSARLWLRRLDTLASQPIDGSDDGDSPFWSPDGRAIGFFANKKLRTISVAGGASDAIGDVSDARGGTWNRDGDIVFAPSSRSGLFRVSASGGPVTPVTPFDPATGVVSQRWPVFLPDQRHFLYFQMAGRAEVQGIYAGSIDGRPPTRLLAEHSNAIYAPDGYLLFGRDNSLLAMPFDARRLHVFGESTPIATGVGRFVTMYTPVAVSDTGRLVYEARDRRSQFVWRQRDGRPVATIGEPIRQGDPVVTAGASEVLSWKGNEADVNLWLDDVARGTTTRITFSGQDVLPVLSPDGEEAIFRSNRNGGSTLYRKSLRRTDPEVLLLKSATRNDPTDWSPDGRYLLYDNFEVGETHTTSDIWVLPLSGDGKPWPYAASPFTKWGGRFSPDGHWVAYVADDTGRPEVYVQAFPATGDRWRVSTTGGDDPQWRRDGRELFFAAASGMLSAVAVTRRGSSIEFSVPQPLFQVPLKYTLLRNRYAVGADGTRFLVDTPMDEEAATPITVVVNWRAALR